MGQKVNPYGFRLGITTDHVSRWFSDSTKPGQRYADYVAEDIKIRRLLQTQLDRAGVSNIEVERMANKLRITIYTSRPGIIIGRKGAEIDKLKADRRALREAKALARLATAQREEAQGNDDSGTAPSAEA